MPKPTCRTILAAAALLLASGDQAARAFACPVRIETEYLALAPADWTAYPPPVPSYVRKVATEYHYSGDQQQLDARVAVILRDGLKFRQRGGGMYTAYIPARLIVSVVAMPTNCEGDQP